MAKVNEQDPCLEWLLSSPVALYISEMDHRQSSTLPPLPPHDNPVTSNTAAPPAQLRWAPEIQNHRRLSISSDSSVPGMVVDGGAPSPGTSWGGDEYNYHASGDAIWDSWLEDTAFESPRVYSPEKITLPLRTRRSNITLPNASLETAGLTKMRSVGDFRRPLGTTILPIRHRTCVLPGGSPLYTMAYEEWDRRALLGDTTSKRVHTDPLLPLAIRSPPSPRKGTLLEPRPRRPIPSINTSLYSVPPPAEWLSQTAVQPLPPLSIGEKSVFEDWDEPKSTFWRRNHKRKRRSSRDSASDGNGNNKSPSKRGRKLLNLLAMPGMM